MPKGSLQYALSLPASGRKVSGKSRYVRRTVNRGPKQNETTAKESQHVDFQSGPHKQNEKTAKESQHVDFQSGPPQPYYPHSQELNFGVRMGTGAYSRIWP